MATKQENINNPKSCWHRAQENEQVFILLGRDVTMPFTIRMWCAERIRRGKNNANDPEILEASALAANLELAQSEWELRHADGSKITPKNPLIFK